MSLPPALKRELRAIGLTTLFFASWFGVLVILKELILADYQIGFRGMSAALIGALVVAKVVLLLERVSLGGWVRRQPAIVDVVLRTTLYGAGVLLVLVLEKAFESRHAFGGFTAALPHVLHHPDIDHVWVNTIVVVGALFVFNLLSVIRRQLGDIGLTRLFLASPARLAPARGYAD